MLWRIERILDVSKKFLQDLVLIVKDAIDVAVL